MEHSDAWPMISALRDGGDWSLEELLRMVEDTGMPFPLTVLVQGYLVKGRAVKSEQWADHLDSVMDDLLGAAANAIAAEQQGLSAEDFASVRATAGDVEKWRAERRDEGWRRQIDEGRRKRADLSERLEEATGGERDYPLERLPDELARAEVELGLPPASLTLADATIIAPGPGGAAQLPIIRVLVREVAAWWPGSFMLDEGGQSRGNA
jgi:hypothetical protein